MAWAALVQGEVHVQLLPVLRGGRAISKKGLGCRQSNRRIVVLKEGKRTKACWPGGSDFLISISRDPFMMSTHSFLSAFLARPSRSPAGSKPAFVGDARCLGSNPDSVAALLAV